MMDKKKFGDRIEIPFSEPVMEFLAELSEQIRRGKELKEDEEIRAFGFWCRRTNLERYKKKYGGNEFRLGRGLVFHIAPSNIPAMFAWSMAIGLLAGNSNIIRLSSRTAGGGLRLKALIEKMLQCSPVSDMVRFVTYDRNDREQTAYYSILCDVRIIWGGDQTAEEIRKCPLRADAYDIIFPERRSCLLLNIHSIFSMEDEKMEELAHRFYKDTYAVDQNACSSPSLVFWHGKEEEADAAGIRWWTAVAKEAARYRLTPVRAVGKLADLCETALLNVVSGKTVRYGNQLWVISIQEKTKEIQNDLTKLRGRFGSFYECRIEQMEELVPIINRRIQTLTFQGYKKEELQKFVTEYRLRGIDRIVPIGQALEMELTWDGIDLIERLSRKIS